MQHCHLIYYSFIGFFWQHSVQHKMLTLWKSLWILKENCFYQPNAPHLTGRVTELNYTVIVGRELTGQEKYGLVMKPSKKKSCAASKLAVDVYLLILINTCKQITCKSMHSESVGFIRVLNILFTCVPITVRNWLPYWLTNPIDYSNRCNHLA